MARRARRISTMLFFIGLLSTRAVSGQTAVGTAPGLWLGPIVGVSNTSLSAPGVPSTSSLTRFSLGAAATIPVGASHVFLRPELLWVGRGAREETWIGRQQVLASYVETPALIGISSAPAAVGGPHVYMAVGGYVAMITSCTIVTSAGLNTIGGGSICEGFNMVPHTFDFGTSLGAGLDTRLGRNLLSVEVRADLGLRSGVLGWKTRNGSLTIGAGYLFAVGW